MTKQQYVERYCKLAAEHEPESPYSSAYCIVVGAMQNHTGFLTPLSILRDLYYAARHKEEAATEIMTISYWHTVRIVLQQALDELNGVLDAMNNAD